MVEYIHLPATDAPNTTLCKGDFIRPLINEKKALPCPACELVLTGRLRRVDNSFNSENAIKFLLHKNGGELVVSAEDFQNLPDDIDQYKVAVKTDMDNMSMIFKLSPPLRFGV